MTLLVVGASGQVARALARREGVVALGRPALDLERAETLAPAVDAHRPRAVAIVGGWTAVDAAESDPDGAMRVNAEGPGALAALCAARAIPVVHVSTDYVFDGARGGYAANEAPNPKTAYGVSKVRGEDAVLAACPTVLIVRTAHVIADGCPWIAWLVDRLARGQTVEAWEDRFNTPTPVDTLATGILDAVGEGRRGIIHVAGGRRVNRLDLFRTIALLRGLDSDLVVPGRCDNPLVPRDLSLVTA